MYKTTGFQEPSGYHGPKCNHRNKFNLVSFPALVDITHLPLNPAKKIIVNYTDEMHEKVIDLALSGVSCRAAAI